MGGHQSKTDTSHTFNPQQWQQISRNQHTRLLGNRSNAYDVIEEYPISISDEKQLQLANQLQQFRVNDPQLVSANYFDIEKSDNMCSKTYSGHLYTEQIPIRLSNIVHVPFPDVLHLYNQAFNGFSRLARVVGPFKINEGCIGINNNHVAKVWHCPNFSSFQPSYQADSQHEMVKNIVSVIETNTDGYSMPQQQPSFSKFLYREGNRVGFGQAKRRLELYANQFNQGVIPRYLSCVEKAGGAHNIRDQWNLTNRNQSQSFGQFIENNPPVYATSTVVNGRPLTASNQMIITNSVPQTAHFYQSSNAYGSETQVQGAPTVFVSPPPQFTSSRVNSQIINTQVRRVQPPSVYTRQVVAQPPVNIFSSRTVNINQPTYLPPTPKFREQVKVLSQPPPQNIQFRTTQSVPQTTTVNRNVQVRQAQPNFPNPVSFEKRVNTVPTPTAVTVQEQPIRQTRLVHTTSERQFNVNPVTIPNAHVRLESPPVFYQNVAQSVPAPTRIATEPAERTVKLNQPQNIIAPLPSQVSIQNSGATNSQKQIVYQPAPVSNQNIVVQQPTIVSQRSASQIPIQTIPTGFVESKQVISTQQIPNPVSSSQLPPPVSVTINEGSRAVTQTTTNVNPIPPIQFSPQPPTATATTSGSQFVQRVPIQSQFLQQIEQPSSLVQTPWISQTLKFQYEQNSASPAVVKQQVIKQKPAETQSTWINDTLNWQLKQNQSPVPVQTTQEQWQSPVFSTTRSQQVDLNQAISASSRYRQENLSESPERNLDLKTQLKSPTDQSISDIQVKQSKLLEEKAFSEPKQSSINTSTRNFYNNLGNNDSGSYSQNEWQYGNDYSTSYRTNEREDNYGNFEKKYDYDFNSYGKSTGQFVKADNEVQQLLKKVENMGETTGNKAAYSFGNTEVLNYDYVANYKIKGDPSPGRIGEDMPEDYSGKYIANYEISNAPYGNYQSNSYNSYQLNYESSSNKATGKQFIPNYSFESKNEYREYKNGELTDGYKVTEKDSSNYGYERTTENLLTGKTEALSYLPSAAITNKFTENTDLKYSMVEDDPYNVQWDPQILADLQANVHGSRKS